MASDGKAQSARDASGGSMPSQAGRPAQDGKSVQENKTSQDGKAQAPGSTLTRKERQKVRDAERPSAPVVYEIIRTQGENELTRPASALWWSGVAAGISIGFSFLTQAALAALFGEAAWAEALAKIGYAVGFLIVILGHQQLFTENVLTAVLPVMARRSWDWLARMLRLWGIVLAANLAGCFIFALALAKLPLVGGGVAEQLGQIVDHMMSNTPFEMFAKGIGAGWLIAALVWILSASPQAGAFIILLLTYLIAFFDFTHIVAGSAEALYGWLNGAVAFERALLGFFLPTLAGNVFGGTVLFSALSYAQVREEIFDARQG